MKHRLVVWVVLGACGGSDSGTDICAVMPVPRGGGVVSLEGATVAQRFECLASRRRIGDEWSDFENNKPPRISLRAKSSAPRLTLLTVAAVGTER